MPYPMPVGEAALLGAFAATLMPAAAFIGCSIATLLPRRAEANPGERLAQSAFDTTGLERLDDFLIERPDGSLVQIDHAVRFPGGILVVETKHWRGTYIAPIDAFGGPWYQEAEDDMLVPAHDGANPFVQNESHVDAVRTATGGRVPVWNVVLTTHEQCYARFADPEDEEEQARAAAIRERSGYTLPLDDFPGLWDLEEVKGFSNAMANRPQAADIETAWALLKSVAKTDARTRRRHMAQVGGESSRGQPSRVAASLLLLAAGIGCAAAALAFWAFQAGILLPSY